MNRAREFADALGKAASTVTDEYRGRLDALGLRATSEIHDWSEVELSNVELRVNFWRGNDLVDFFEDFVIKQAEPIGSVQEVEEWLREGFDSALSDGS